MSCVMIFMSYAILDYVLFEGGGGPKAALLEKMIAEEQLEHRVQMVGAVPHEQARNVLVMPSSIQANVILA